MRHWLHITCENLEKHSTESLNGVCSFGGVPGAQLKLERLHTFTWAVTPDAEIRIAVTPGATLAEPPEGRLVKPGFREHWISNTGVCLCRITTGQEISGILPFHQQRSGVLASAALAQRGGLSPPSQRWTAVRTHQLYAVNKWNNTVRPLFL